MNFGGRNDIDLPNLRLIVSRGWSFANNRMVTLESEFDERASVLDIPQLENIYLPNSFHMVVFPTLKSTLSFGLQA